ncbi:rhodanese-like domain-containing protein [Flavobacterium sp. UMI-01]|uniref:rhodanese-like domain-containing protein n=1 Tax=Flavobacterium sp. UMI-01 TaxID=1441053 RepID=UPI0020845CE9|nr:rhodanese-like domain-containing protein [Flavobacterium sp. UMI-01]GIZ10149.1 hypothetical protein FUMI01_28750 [Flavobacterium sp. UMI-01]
MATILKKYNKETVPYVHVNALKNNPYILLDAREAIEFKVSHIPNAFWVGFSTFKPQQVTKLVKNRNTPILVYCSIGIRSEQIAEQLLKLGYTRVYNLFGGIFEYKNKGGQVVNSQQQATDSVHAYNKQWSQYLTKGIKIYE